MTVEWRASATIAAPLEQVWDAMVDVEKWPEWTPTVSEAAWLEPGPTKVGRKARLRQPKLGRAVWEVTEFAAPATFAWTHRVPGMVTEGRHELEEGADGQVVLRLTLTHTGPMAKLAGWVAGGLTGRYVSTEAESLKRRCEGA